MPRAKTSLDYSPTRCHRRMMDRMEPSLGYRGGDVKKWQRKLRRKLKELLGSLPQQRFPLNVRSLWKRGHQLGTIEKIVFTSEPGADVPAYLCLPKNATPPYPLFICAQGHSTGMHNSIAVKRENERKKIAVEGDRDFGLGCTARGIAALCIEQRSFGERLERDQEKTDPHSYCHEATMHALMLGRTLIGERVYDVDRAIDYLESRGDVDMNRLGIMGNSGGGTTTVFAAALLSRLRYAMPSCYFCTFRDSIMSIYHCECNYVPGLLPVAEMSDVMGLFAPKPVVIVAGKEDPIFPIKAVRKAFRNVKRIYREAGAGAHCHLVVGEEGHRFYADLAWPRMLREMEPGKTSPGGRGRPKAG